MGRAMSEKQRKQATVRTGQGPERLPRGEFERRMRERFFDPAFDNADAQIESIIEAAWDGYAHGRKAPRTCKAGAEFADPEYKLSVEWLATRDAIRAAQSAQAEATRPARILLICASPRNDKTCPGEISKSLRLLQAARDMVAQGGNECDVLDLSLLTSEY